MTDWYRRQFGDQRHFAVLVALGDDPHPIGLTDRESSWGTLELWADGRCLTRNVSEHGVADGVRWTLLPILEWLLSSAIRLVNEEPYPTAPAERDVADATAWYEATLNPPLLPEPEETRWFLARSEWRTHHALRRASEDAALPNLVFRRLNAHVEISWDHEAWGTVRPDVQFVEGRGRVLVSARTFAATLRQAAVDVCGVLAERYPTRSFAALHERARTLAPVPADWGWLVHRATADAIRSGMPDLARRLDEATAADTEGWFVPHTVETVALRLTRVDAPADIEALLNALRLLPREPLREPLRSLVRPSPADSVRPWDEGNARAESVRDALGWGAEPAPDLVRWLSDAGVRLELGVPASMHTLTERTDDARAMAHANPRGSSSAWAETRLATALGHLLLDDAPIAVDGDWEHWPTSARARAFGVALLLPEDGIRALLGAAPRIGVAEVHAVMRHFRTGPYATAYRLANLGLVSRHRAPELAAEASRSQVAPT